MVPPASPSFFTPAHLMPQRPTPAKPASAASVFFRDPFGRVANCDLTNSVSDTVPRASPA